MELPASGYGSLVECVPNVSEGRRADVIRRIVDAARMVRGSYVLDVHSDVDHHRSVVTIVGAPGAVGDAAFNLVATAAETIDLRRHQGVHPRIGAADVLPFVPLGGTSMATCVELAHEVGYRIAKDLGIPVYFYGEAAVRPERRSLADVRRGGYEALAKVLAHDPSRRPDAGPSTIGPAGATVVGARRPLIAFNVQLLTDDLRIAQVVARAVRESSGGLKGVQALGLPISRPGVVQVSMNVTDLGATPLHVVMEHVRAEASARGVGVADCELVGLMPLDAALGGAGEFFTLPMLGRGQVIETAFADAASRAI